jgi:low affinity Fe/Cu permease
LPDRERDREQDGDTTGSRGTTSTSVRLPTPTDSAREAGADAYPGVMGPLSTGSATWDVILQVGIAVCLVLTIVLLIRNYRGRR